MCLHFSVEDNEHPKRAENSIEFFSLYNNWLFTSRRFQKSFSLKRDHKGKSNKPKRWISRHRKFFIKHQLKLNSNPFFVSPPVERWQTCKSKESSHITIATISVLGRKQNTPNQANTEKDQVL